MAIVVGVLVAVAGWLVNAILARRAIRRNMRIEYLLSAYRRLEQASNRQMTESHKAALEEAISDIQLLGSPHQVKMATAFARQFAEDHKADTVPLLEDLRASLRHELQLESVPPRQMWLRIASGLPASSGPTVGDGSWAVWEQRGAAVATSVRAAGAFPPADNDDPLPAIEGASPFVQKMLELARQSPIGAIVACQQRIGTGLIDLLVGEDTDAVRRLNVTELAHLANERGVINEATRNGIEGVAVMHTMALLDQARLTEREARQFIGLTEGLLLAMRS